ncbi:MAG: hypothetical protein ACFFEE_00570 [Candidatus Thorarchaeota archaeon]
MNPRREYFEEPVVRVETLKARFPRMCPVCGSPSTKIERMKIAKDRQWDPVYRPYLTWRRPDPSSPEMKVFLIHVCDDHADLDAGSDRVQTLCLIVDGLLIGFLIFGLLFMGDRLWRGQSITIWPFSVIGICVIALIMSLIVFRPNALAQAVRIVGFDLGMQNVLISFKNPKYRDEFMKENQMTAELVSWIMKSDS